MQNFHLNAKPEPKSLAAANLERWYRDNMRSGSKRCPLCEQRMISRTKDCCLVCLVKKLEEPNS